MNRKCRKCRWTAICLPLGPETMFRTHGKILIDAFEKYGTLGPCCHVLEVIWKREREGNRGSEYRGNTEYR